MGLNPENRNVPLNLRVKASEMSTIRSHAERADMTLSEYVRRRLLDVDPEWAARSRLSAVLERATPMLSALSGELAQVVEEIDRRESTDSEDY